MEEPPKLFNCSKGTFSGQKMDVKEIENRKRGKGDGHMGKWNENVAGGKIPF
jgi:hypothetical protein